MTQTLATTESAPRATSFLVSRPIDLAEFAEAAMRDLRDELGHTVVLSLMTARGALVISTFGQRLFN
jgi:DNA-binding IclR family transcriptional regulator